MKPLSNNLVLIASFNMNGTHTFFISNSFSYFNYYYINFVALTQPKPIQRLYWIYISKTSQITQILYIQKACTLFLWHLIIISKQLKYLIIYFTTFTWKKTRLQSNLHEWKPNFSWQMVLSSVAYYKQNFWKQSYWITGHLGRQLKMAKNLNC